MNRLQRLPNTNCQQKSSNALFAFDQFLMVLLKSTMNLKHKAKKAGIRITISAPMLRHSVATHLLEKGTVLRYTQELLGHGSSKTTAIYTQVSTQEIGKIKNPLDDFYKSKSSTIHSDLGSIVEHNKNITEINTPKGVHIQ